jgi:hypothetical protein
VSGECRPNDSHRPRNYEGDRPDWIRPVCQVQSEGATTPSISMGGTLGGAARRSAGTLKQALNQQTRKDPRRVRLRQGGGAEQFD